MSASSDGFRAGRQFMYSEGRLLERRVFAALFEGAPVTHVADVLRGYQNADGGFGHGLEPDKRCPDSQPLDVAFALESFDAVGYIDRQMALRAGDFLASVSDPSGAVPIVLPSVAQYPRADHWADGHFPPALNPTAGIVGLLYRFGIEHPWVERATAFCWSRLEQEPPTDAHVILDVLSFLEHAPDRQRAEPLIPLVVARLPSASYYRSDPEDPEYGLSPLHFASSPDSPCRSLFSDELLDAHLDRLQAEQQADGGWPLSWNPPTQASVLEWRGHETLWALRVLSAYGRL